MKKEKCEMVVLGQGELIGWQRVGTTKITSISIEGMTINKKIIGKKLKLYYKLVD